MTGAAHQKVNAGHLKRNAYLYVRQSTLRQVFENTESTKRLHSRLEVLFKAALSTATDALPDVPEAAVYTWKAHERVALNRRDRLPPLSCRKGRKPKCRISRLDA
jgi:hypothetical protein